MSGDVAVIQGPGFIKIKDSSRMRMALTLEMKSTLSWKDSFSFYLEGEEKSPRDATAATWKSGGVNFRTATAFSYPGKDKSELHPHVVDGILNPDVQCSFRLNILRQRLNKDGTCVLAIEALEVLQLKEESGDLRVLLVVHTEASCEDYSTVRDAPHTRRMLHFLCNTLSKVLEEEAGCAEGTLSLPGRVKTDESTPPITTVTWVPQKRTAAWHTAPTVQEARELGLEVSPEIIDVLKVENDFAVGVNQGHACALSISTALIIAGWQWGPIPASGGTEFGDARLTDSMRRLHSLSQSRVVYITEHGIAYVGKQRTDYSVEAVRRMLTRNPNTHLLITLNQMRTLDLSRRLIALAHDLRSATNELGEDGASTKEMQLGGFIDRMLALDAEATAFLASEWWADATSHS